jgi:hypothetical protein
MPDPFLAAHIAPIVSAASRNNVPAVYNLSTFARDGGLLSYGPDLIDLWGAGGGLYLLRFRRLTQSRRSITMVPS